MAEALQKYADDRKKHRKDTFIVEPRDGIVVRLVKRIFGCDCWHCPIECFIDRRVAQSTDNLNVKPNEAFNSIVECYWLWWTVLVVVAYAVTTLLAVRGDSSGSNCCWAMQFSSFFAIGAFCAYRILEITATSMRLHFLRQYGTDAPPHALILTFLAFVQVTVCFGVLYWIQSASCGDPYSSPAPTGQEPTRLTDSWINALYFSAVTIVTLGYGDFSPQFATGKALVIWEAFTGLLLIVVSLQRVVAATQSASDSSSDEEREQIAPP